MGKNAFNVLLIFSVLLAGARELRAAEKTRMKIPHSHASLMGGGVAMLGDDHFEVKLGAVPKTLEVYASDRVRDPQPVSLFSELTVNLVEGEKKTVLKLKPGPSDSVVVATLPTQFAKDTAKIEVFARRKDPPSGHVPASGPASVSFKDISSRKPANGHTGHPK